MSVNSRSSCRSKESIIIGREFQSLAELIIIIILYVKTNSGLPISYLHDVWHLQETRMKSILVYHLFHGFFSIKMNFHKQNYNDDKTKNEKYN